MKRIVPFIAAAFVASCLTGCFEPGKTIFGTPILHHVVAFNSSDFNVMVNITPKDPANGTNTKWCDVPAQYSGSVGRASWDLEEGWYYVSARYKADGKIYLNNKEVRLDSNPQNRVFEGQSVAAVINVTPGHFSFAAGVQILPRATDWR